MALAVHGCVRGRPQRALALALALGVPSASGLTAEASGRTGRAVRRHTDGTHVARRAVPTATHRPVLGAGEPHDAYRMSPLQRALARTKGHITDLQAAALVADGRISHREAYLLVASGVSARRARWAIDQEPGDVGLAWSARTEKFIRYGLSRREARLLSRSGAQLIRVRDLIGGLVFSFFTGTDATFTGGTPEEPEVGAGGDDAWAEVIDWLKEQRAAEQRQRDPDAIAPYEAHALEASLRFFGLDAGLGRAAVIERAKKSYRKIAREAHPDVTGSRTDLTEQQREDITARFGEAAEHHEKIEDVLGGTNRKE